MTIPELKNKEETMNSFVRNPQWYENYRRKQRETIAKCVQKKINETGGNHPVAKTLATLARVALEYEPRRY